MNIAYESIITHIYPQFLTGSLQGQTDISGFYEYLIEDCLELDQSDARAIEKAYNLHPTQSYFRGYRSSYLSEWSRNVIEHEIAKHWPKLSSVAGIYCDERLRLNWPTQGVIVPCKFRGKICTLAIYSNPKEPNFYWLSSRNFPNGCGASPPIHIAGYLFAKQSQIAVLTSHIIAADAFALKNHVCAVATNNLNPNKIARQLREALPFVRSVVVSRDCASQALRQALNSQNFKVVEESEDENSIAA